MWAFKCLPDEDDGSRGVGGGVLFWPAMGYWEDFSFSERLGQRPTYDGNLSTFALCEERARLTAVTVSPLLLLLPLSPSPNSSAVSCFENPLRKSAHISIHFVRLLPLPPLHFLPLAPTPLLNNACLPQFSPFVVRCDRGWHREWFKYFKKRLSGASSR